MRFFSNDDSRAYFTNNSELERKLRRNISPSGVVRAKRSRLGSVNELNIPEIKIRSHSCPTVPLSKTTMDLNRLCMVIKQKSSQARHDLYNISTHCTIEILDENQKELIPFVGRTPDAVIADSEMTLMIINKMIDGTDKIKRKFDKHKGERKKKVVKAARTVKYILSDLYNNLILLEAALGRQNFRILKTDFDDRMRDKSLRMALSRCHSKCLLDLKMDSDIPKLAIRERQARNKNFEAIFNDRKDLVILSKKL